MGGAGRAAAILSFRLGGPDGVSVVAAQWQSILERAGWTVRTVAAAGPVHVTVPGLGIEGATEQRGPDPQQLGAALADIDVVVVENLCSLPLNPAATEAVVTALAGRPALMHHHDLPWQRPRFAHIEGWPATDPAWRHVTINELTRDQLAERGLPAAVIRNGFDPHPPAGHRARAREALGIAADDRLAIHPVRAIPRKDVAAAVAAAHRLGAAYWLLGPAEEGYEHELRAILDAANGPVHRNLPRGITVADAYAASDVVVFPSTWEGFGNPVAESALHRRPLLIRRYPVARELQRFGFRWFDIDGDGDLDDLRSFLERPDAALLDNNQQVVRTHFSVDTVAQRLLPLMDELARG